MCVRRSPFLLFWIQSTTCFGLLHRYGRFPLNRRIHRPIRRAIPINVASEPNFSVPSSRIDTDLTPDEKTIVNVFRKYGPSVAFVTSVAFLDETITRTISSAKNRPRGGMPLGSGSAFTVSDDGYLLTNYHVIERAYRIKQNRQRLHEGIDNLLQNITNIAPTILPIYPNGSLWWNEAVNSTKSILRSTIRLDAKVYIRINSSTRFSECRIVDVVPELDMAVLKIIEETGKDNVTIPYTPIPYGSSSNLLVGQRVIAIGNVSQVFFFVFIIFLYSYSHFLQHI